MSYRQQIFVHLRDTITQEMSQVTITIDFDAHSRAEAFRAPLVESIGAVPAAVLELEDWKHVEILHHRISPLREISEAEEV